MKLTELFRGFQGEGPTTGRSALFIRFAGCNLSCDICDTKYSWQKGELDIVDIPFERLIAEIEKVDRVIFTGGEPLLAGNVIHMVNIINEFGETKKYEIETNGTKAPPPEFIKLINKYDIRLNVSPKMNVEQIGNSDTTPWLINYLSDYSKWCVKFLLASEKDLDHINVVSRKWDLPSDKVWIQPMGVESSAIKNIVEKYETVLLDKGWNLSARLHVLLFENQKGK